MERVKLKRKTRRADYRVSEDKDDYVRLLND